MKFVKYLPDWIAAIILLQTLYFKFSGSPESVYIFTTVGMEPAGRIGIGIAELIAAVLLIYRPTNWIGGVLSLGVISGAIFMHLTQLGIQVQNDGGYLFTLAVVVFVCSAYVVVRERQKLLSLIGKK